MNPPPGLVIAAHGTRNPHGVSVIRHLAELVRARVPGRPVEVGFVDVVGPALGEVTRRMVSTGHRCVVVPLFLGNGYHVQVDLPRVASAGQVTVTPAVGPAPQVLRAVADRLRWACVASGGHPPDAVVLAAAGSSSATSRTQARQAADALAVLLDRPVTLGYLTCAEPSPGAAVRWARRGAGTVGIASYLLAPGVFHDRLRRAGGDVLADPIGAHPALVDVVLRRYLDVVRRPAYRS